MNEIEKQLNVFELERAKVIKNITKIIQNKIDEIDPNIKIYLYVDIHRISVHYKSFVFNFTYYYQQNLCLRGYGKTNTIGYSGDRYTKEEQREREKAYVYVRDIMKRCLK